MHQTEIRKAVDRPLLGIPGGGGIFLIPLIVVQRKADISRSLSVSGILLERGGCGGGGGGGGGIAGVCGGGMELGG